MKRWFYLASLILGFMTTVVIGGMAIRAAKADKKEAQYSGQPITLKNSDWEVPDERLKLKFQDEQPIYFLTRNQSPKEWDKLPAFWNEGLEQAIDPSTGKTVERRIVKIKVPLGLTQNPPVPAENAMTVSKWKLGKQLYFDPILCSDSTVACASCHSPEKGYTDQLHVSTGISGLQGGVSAPTVINSAYNQLQFWDGRAVSLEDQAQGPVQNPVEMHDGRGHAWNQAVARIRAKPEYVRRFHEAFGTAPTRDAIAKAIACYERTVLSANSIHDRAELAMRRRVDEEESGKYALAAKDYEKVLKDALNKKDQEALQPFGIRDASDAGKIPALAQNINNGRVLFFGKARCNSCHVGDNFTDNQFHNLGVGIKDNRLSAGNLGRFAQLMTGHKNTDLIGAFKTPTLRSLLRIGPYMHDGGEKTLEQVVEFYDRGGNVNEFLDTKMRDFEAEKAYLQSQLNKTPYQGPEVKVFTHSGKPVIPLRLNLTKAEEADLVLFLKALNGDPVDPMVADPVKMPN